jgi:hypothetical protein
MTRWTIRIIILGLGAMVVAASASPLNIGSREITRQYGERAPLEGTISLVQGENTIRLRMAGLPGQAEFDSVRLN